MQDREECVNSPVIRHLIQNSGKNSFLSMKLSAHLKSLQGMFFYSFALTLTAAFGQLHSLASIKNEPDLLSLHRILCNRLVCRPFCCSGHPKSYQAQLSGNPFDAQNQNTRNWWKMVPWCPSPNRWDACAV